MDGTFIMIKKLAVCVPYRNREEHLRIFVPYLSNFLEAKGIQHKIFICNQVDNKKFNRGKTKNIAFNEAKKEGFDYFAFHDIDLLPEENSCDYSYPEACPVHLSSQIDEFNYKLPYPENFGGVVLFSREQFEKVNGYYNDYWEWGAEDDDLFWRCKQKGLIDIKYLEGEIKNCSKISFNGKNNKIIIPCTPSLQKLTNGSFSFSVLVKTGKKSDFPMYLQSKPNCINVDMPILSRCKSDFLAYNNSSTYNGIINNYKEEVSELWVTRSQNLWTYLTLTVDSKKKEVSFYVNGNNSSSLKSLICRDKDTYSGTLYDYKNVPYQIGARKGNFLSRLLPGRKTRDFFKGEVARVCFWKKTLSAEDVQKLHKEKEINSSLDDLVLYYDFKKIINGIISDLSGNNNHGILKGGKLGNEDIKIIKSELPYRRQARFKSLPHNEEGYAIPSNNKKSIARNERILVRKLKEGKINIDKEGLNNLNYELIRKQNIFGRHSMLDVRC